MLGSATLTMKKSSTDMNVPVSTTARGSQWRSRSLRVAPATAAGGGEVIVDMPATVAAGLRQVDYL